MDSIGQRSPDGQVTASGVTASRTPPNRGGRDIGAAAALILMGSVLAACGFSGPANVTRDAPASAAAATMSVPFEAAAGGRLEVADLAAGEIVRRFRVDDPGDQPDAIPGDGVCATARGRDGGGCTLRAAVEEANAAAGTDRIDLDVAAIGLTGRDLDITDAVTIRGREQPAGGTDASGGTVIDARGLSRIFDICPDQPSTNGAGCADPASAIVEIRDVTLSGGRTRGSGGAIRNNATLHLRHVAIRDSEAAEFGGAVFNDGGLRLTDTTLSDSRSGFYGGGLFNRGRATLDRTRVEGNTAGVAGGGIANFGPLELTRVTVTINQSPDVGAGLYDAAAPRSVAVRDTVIRDNRTAGSGADVTVLQHAVDSFAVWTPTLVAEAL